MFFILGVPSTYGTDVFGPSILCKENRDDIMAVRIFKCTQCGHNMSFLGLDCHKCYSGKKIYQSPSFYVVLMVIVLFALGAAV